MDNKEGVENGEEIKNVVGTTPSTSDLEWIKLGKNIFEQSPGLADNVAKYFVTLNTTLITIYTGILTFLKIPEKITTFHSAWLSWTLIAIPIILWLLSIYKNVDVCSPRLVALDLDCPQEIEAGIEHIINEKIKVLKWGKIFFIIALFIAAFIIMTGCNFTQTKSVQFVIDEDHLPIFENMSIGVNNKTMTTTSLTLLGEEDIYYKVRLDDRKTVKFNKNLVEGTIYYS